jgi:cytidine deaminase
MCAERGAIAAAIVAGETILDAVAVVTARGEPCAPCGMCRQALSEFGPDMEVVLVADDGREVRSRLGALLPDAFGPAMLARPRAQPNGELR